MTFPLLPCGEQAVMVQVDDTSAAIDLARWLVAADLPGIVDIVPAARTVLIRCDDRTGRIGAEEALAGYRQSGVPAETGRLVEVPVVYDGADLADVADLTGLSVGEVIVRHSTVIYTAAFCGFAPGFSYLAGLDSRLHLPRRATPRPRIPAGSVAIAADFTGVYPTDSPGGWHLLGHTDAVLWDVARSEPALLAPGCRVRFVEMPAPR